MKHLAAMAFIACAWLGGCSATWSNFVPVPLAELLAKCHRSENCSVHDGNVARSALSNAGTEVARLQRLCLDGKTTIETVKDVRGTHSGMLFAHCVAQGRKLANITLWYFPDGRYDLTLQDCIATKCNKWFVPI